MTFLFENNAESTLAAGITNVATSLTVQSGDGALFPNPSGGDTFRATLTDASNNIEIVDVTARTGDVFTIVRGQEGSIAKAYLSADNVGLRLTRDTLAEFAQNADAVLKAVAAIKSLGALTFNDSIQLNFGTGIDAEVYFDGTQWNFDLNNDGIIAFRDGNSGNANQMTLDIANGNLEIQGDFTLNGELILQSGYSEDSESYTVTTGTKTLNLALATVFHPTGPMTAVSYTFVFSNPAATGRVTSFTLELSNMTANTNPTPWPAGVKWIGGFEPIWTSGIDYATFFTRDGGTTWYGFAAGLDMS